jgi:hypothetical protein
MEDDSLVLGPIVHWSFGGDEQPEELQVAQRELSKVLSKLFRVYPKLPEMLPGFQVSWDPPSEEYKSWRASHRSAESFEAPRYITAADGTRFEVSGAEDE